MTLYEFNRMNLNDQADYTWQAGHHLAHRREGEMMVNLYKLPEFFVEIYVSDQTEWITRLAGFKNAKRLDAYVDFIDLNDLFHS